MHYEKQYPAWCKVNVQLVKAFEKELLSFPKSTINARHVTSPIYLSSAFGYKCQHNYPTYHSVDKRCRIWHSKYLWHKTLIAFQITALTAYPSMRKVINTCLTIKFERLTINYFHISASDKKTLAVEVVIKISTRFATQTDTLEKWK